VITELVLDVFFALVRGIVALFPTGAAPGWLDDGAAKLADLTGYASGLGAWIPFGLAGTVLAAVLACMLAGFVIRLVRIVASFFTAGGGAAG
jgi:hypothetical protein